MKKSDVVSKNLHFIAYCGLYCPKCYKNKIASLAKKLLFELESAQGSRVKITQGLLDMKPNLDKLIAFECKKFCRENDEKSSTCQIKQCCVKYEILGCWECLNLESCKKLKSQFLVNNKKIRKLGINSYIKQYS